MIVST